MRHLHRFAFLPGVLAVCLVAPRIYAGITFTTLVSFNGTNGANPVANLLQGADGNFYGTAPNDGASNSGTIFEISPDGGFFTNFYSFTGGLVPGRWAP
jgi:uncharacterized repeat protein (TIGR03803 family)